MSIKKDDKVKVVVGTRYYDILANQIGQVVRTYDFGDGIAIVEFPEGMTVKLSFCELVKIEAKPQATEEVKNDPPEGAKRITEEDYKNAVSESAADFAARSGAFTQGMSALIVGADIGKKLFESQNSVVMTKDEFIVTMWNGCSPVNINKSTGGKLPLDHSIAVSISSITALRKVADILFDESENA